MRQSQLKTQDIDYDTLYPPHEPPHLRPPHATLSRTIANLMCEIPGWFAEINVDIYDPYDNGKWRQPDVIVLDYPFPKETIHLDTLSAPIMVFEITSPGNREHDLVTKVSIYRDWKIPIYIILDTQKKEIVIHKSKSLPQKYKAELQRISISAQLEIAWDGGDNFQAFWLGQKLEPNLQKLLAFAQAVKERENAITEKDNLLTKQDNLLTKQDNLIAEKDNVIAEKDNVIAEKDKLIAKLLAKNPNS
jgi:hypothetical protein